MSNLNESQKNVVESVLDENHVCITGPAGVGKSFLIGYLTSIFETDSKKFEILAPTGVAALNVSGVTIHRFLCLLPEVKTLEDYLRKCMKRSKVNFKTLDYIIIDEISMVHPDIFLLFDQICRFHRNSRIPFGGIKLIFIGDFYQLPPVPSKESASITQKYIFETDLWKRLDIKVHKLETIVRQTDLFFINCLNDIRAGNVTNQALKLIANCSRNKIIPGKHYIKLFAKNVEKRLSNETELDKLSGVSYTLDSKDVGNIGYLTGHRIEKRITLKVDCIVMLLWNLPEQELCNGSIGRVISITNDTVSVLFDTKESPIDIHRQTFEIKKKNDLGVFKIVASRTQVPLCLAYALTVNKSQGLTFENMILDCSDIFAFGQFYVGISRCKTKEGLIIKNFKKEYIMKDPRVDKFYNTIF
jgi:ATP-dependent exoDNAse (exonuclease V) alpha subunit